MLLLVPSALPSPHTRQRNTGAGRRGTWLRFQSGLETGSSSPSELWSLKELEPASQQGLTLLHPFSKCSGPQGDDGKGGVHTRIRKPGSGCAVVKEDIKG